MTGGTFSLQEKKTQYRDILQCRDRMVAMGALRPWFHQVIGCYWIFTGVVEFKELTALCFPVLLHHPGKPVDDDIEEATNNESQ